MNKEELILVLCKLRDNLDGLIQDGETIDFVKVLEEILCTQSSLNNIVGVLEKKGLTQ